MSRVARIAAMPLILSCSCTSQAPQSPTTVEVRAAPSASEASPVKTAEIAVPKGSWVGGWQSSECGERKYPRRLDLADDGTFIMMDLISPCPPGAKCVWSGVAARKGTWSASGNRSLLTYEPAGSATGNGKGQPAPTELTWDRDKNVPVEGHDCAYERR